MELILGGAEGPDIAKRVGRRPPHAKGCAHFGQGVVVDETAHELRCKACDAKLDPIRWILQLARDSEWVLKLREEKRELLGARKELQREVANLKAAKRRASR